VPGNLAGNIPSANIALYMSTYFHNQSNTALASILAWRALAMGINKQMSGTYNEVVPIAPDQIAFQNIMVSYHQIGRFFQEVISQATTQFIEKLMIQKPWWEEVQAEISLRQAAAFENVHSQKAYWNFLVPNPTYQQLSKYLYMKILDSQIGSQWFNTRGLIQVAQKVQYLQEVYEFQKLLMILIYGTSGAPSRASEIPPILLANTPQSTRTLFIDRQHHLILLRLRYSKTANRNNIEQQAIRILPESVSFLVLAYMGLVLPFIQFLDIMQFGEYTRSRELLFWYKNDLISERVLGQKLQTLSHQIMGQRIVIRYWRHIIQGFIRYYMNWDLENPWTGDESKFLILIILHSALFFTILHYSAFCTILHYSSLFCILHYLIHILCTI
jgi:hypothetical protein